MGSRFASYRVPASTGVMFVRLACCAACLLALRPALAQTPDIAVEESIDVDGHDDDDNDYINDHEDIGIHGFMAEGDTDKDGKLSKAEVLAFIAVLENDDLESTAEGDTHRKKMDELTEENFAKIDIDGDGFLDASGVQELEDVFKVYFQNLGNEEDL